MLLRPPTPEDAPACGRSAPTSFAAATEIAGPGLILPMRNGELFRWCLEHGLRVGFVTTLMSVGLYNEPAGAFLPSVLY